MTTTDRLPMVTPADWVAGPRQGQWTYSSYAALTGEGQHYEIVDGVLYMTPSPSWSHQEIVGRLFRYLSTYIETANLGGVFVAPIDVELSPDNVFQPDVVVLLKTGREKLKGRHIVGPPDVIVEVVSPGSATMDRHDKYQAYAKAKVPEYWIVEPGTQTVELLVLTEERYRSLGVFQGKAILPSSVLPGFEVQVDQFFVSAWA
ncbi:MAG: Uma2 family endonuclease [Ktedonobacteraceae bacterium]